jgi:hypothetical protein
MSTNNFKPFFNGYIPAVLTSLCSFVVLFIIICAESSRWFFLEIFFSVFVATVLHFLFLLGFYLLILPLITYLDPKSEGLGIRKLMDRYIPIFAIPFAIVIGLLWWADFGTKFFTFVSTDMLFTSYIGLYYYVKNKCNVNETA